MRKALSVKAIEAFKPKVKRYEVHDLLCPGFSLRVFPTGRKVFTVKYRYGLTSPAQIAWKRKINRRILSKTVVQKRTDR